MVAIKVTRMHDDWVELAGPDGWEVGECDYDFWLENGGPVIEHGQTVLMILQPKETA